MSNDLRFALWLIAIGLGTFLLAGLLKQIERIHTHLHVIECELHGYVTDDDGKSVYRGFECDSKGGRR